MVRDIASVRLGYLYEFVSVPPSEHVHSWGIQQRLLTKLQQGRAYSRIEICTRIDALMGSSIHNDWLCISIN